MSETKKLSLLDVMSKYNKEHGAGSIATLSDSTISTIETTSTGVLSLDMFIGGKVAKGFPKGGIVELYGPEASMKTTTALYAMKQCQQETGKMCVILDVEQAFNRDLAEKIGINQDKLVVAQPQTTQDTFALAEELIATGEIGMILVDSVAAMVPREELEGEYGDSKMGIQARLMSQGLRKITGITNRTNTCLVFINQTRDKIGVMYGCLHADMPILFTDGRSIPIRKVVEEKISGNVWCYNETTQQIESKPLIDWHYNGDVKNNSDYLHIETNSIDGKGRFGITVTPDHKVLSEKGWVEAKNINVGDKLLSKYESLMIADTEDFLKGCLVGDSHISIRDKNTGCIKFQDSKNPEYVKWKVDLLSSVLDFKKVANRWDSNYTFEFSKLKNEIQNRNPLQVFKDGVISDLSLAIWIMDDGHFRTSHKNYILSVKRFKNDIETLKSIGLLFSNKGLEFRITNSGAFAFTVKSSLEIAKIISRFVPPSMKYKLPESLQETLYVKPVMEKTTKTGFVTVVLKREASARQLRQKGKYDISVEGNHNYFSGGYKNGVLVHNSPETTTGGNALKFYASLRIRCSSSALKDKEDLGRLVTYKLVKTKISASATGKSITVPYFYEQGFDRAVELAYIAKERGYISNKGAWYYDSEGIKIAQGLDGVISFIKDNEGFEKDLTSKIFGEKEIIDVAV